MAQSTSNPGPQPKISGDPDSPTLKLPFGLKRLLPALAIIVAGWLVFQPAMNGDWLWDDNLVETDNVALRTLPGLKVIWTMQEDWPLTMTLFWAEWHVWGKNPAPFHICNLMLHLACGLLVWRLLSRLGLRWAWLGGLLFVIHPLAVETAAWICETKNTLSLLFLLLSLDAWLDYGTARGRWNYARSVFFYLAAMLSKTSVIMLPAALLLYVWWKRGRISRREMAEMIPYVLVAVVFGAITFYLQSHQNIDANAELSGNLLIRLKNAMVAWLFYLGQFLFPVGLLPVYPQWKMDHRLLEQLAPPAAALVLGGWWVWRQGWGRHAALGLGFFTLNLLPVLGIVWMKYLNVSPVADHFVYLPMIGLIGLTVAGLEQINAALKPDDHPWCIAVVAALMLLLGFESHTQAKLFVNHQTMWAYTLERNPDAWPAINDQGNDLMEEGRVTEALEYYQRALKIYPQDPDIITNVGSALARTGQLPEAMQKYQEALRLQPNHMRAHMNLGNVLLQTGRTHDAIAEYQKALALDPDNAPARYNLGNAFFQAGRFSEAVDQYGMALAARPNEIVIWINMGAALQQMGLLSDAMDHYQKALQLDPQSAEAHAGFGSVLEQLGRIPEAMAQYQTVLQLNPGQNDVRNHLKLLEQGQKGVPASK
jgi:tetratricopeptide (TPR) repeat protein